MPQVYTSTETYHGILVAGLPLFYEFEAGGNIWPGMVVELDAPVEGDVITMRARDNVPFDGGIQFYDHARPDVASCFEFVE